MITRLVRMRFRPDAVEEFLSLYAEARSTISSQPGCMSVQLLRESDDPTAFATWSVWESQTALDNYRTSEFFQRFWPQVKVLFLQRAEAVSFEDVEAYF